MQQTTKYKLNLIDPSDEFSPDPLNENARAVETQLLAREAAEQALDGKVSAEASARESADSTLRTDFAAADAALDTKLSGAIDTAKSGLNSSIQSLRTALGSGGSTCRIQTGSYTGNGNTSKSLSFSFKPWMVFVGSIELSLNDGSPLVLMRELPYHEDERGGRTVSVSWSASGVTITHNDPAYGANVSGNTYYYVAIGS